MQKEGIAYENAVRQLERYQMLRAETREQVMAIAGRYEGTIRTAQMQYAIKGADDATALIGIAGRGKILGTFDKLPVTAIEEMVGMLAAGSPLNVLIADAWPDSWVGMSQALIEGIALGHGPRQIARDMRTGLSQGLNRLITIARTEELRAYRQSSVAQYRQSGVVTGFQRLASKGDRTCMACLTSDGEWFEILDDFTDHPNGRCTCIPAVKGAPLHSWEKGSDWFIKQPEATQRKMMGNQYFEAWKAGKFKLSDLRSTAHSDKWGDSPMTTALGSLISKEEQSAIRISLNAARPKKEPYVMVRVDRGKAPTKKAYNLIENYEDRIRNLPKETSRIFDSNGKIIFEKSGNINSIHFSDQEFALFERNVFTHNHPGGSTLSPEDVFCAFDFKSYEIRAAGSNGTYYLRPKSTVAVNTLIKEFKKELVNAPMSTKEEFQKSFDDAWKTVTTKHKIPYGLIPIREKKNA
jgi:SPP1 gp7 family putative phage head morphogenesis protein